MRYVVIDFEATCDEPYNPAPQEIIEFPCVLVDPSIPTVGPEFHAYVRPAAHPRLTEFCRNLTGIRQEQVDQGEAFPAVLPRADEWLRAHAGGDFIVVTCGDWDLGSLLPRQCEQHQLPVPRWADSWCNLEKIFEQESGRTERTNLAGMAAALGVALKGRAHSGIDDARNVAGVLRALLDREAEIAHTAGWRCLGCGRENLYRARACSRCGKAAVELKPGDWLCPRCRFANFASRDRCYDCGSARPGEAAVMKRGDWVCGKCGGHNFARRRSCFQCDAARP
jgi:ERI1 exoribonuclease 2